MTTGMEKAPVSVAVPLASTVVDPSGRRSVIVTGAFGNATPATVTVPPGATSVGVTVICVGA